MMYKSEAAIAVKVGGKVVREVEPGKVNIPFKSEYSVYFKNLADRSALVTVTIDGEDVLKGNKLIVHSNKSIDLERYLDTFNKGNKFKFIEMTDSIADNRGVKSEDGVIRVEWQFEKKVIRQEAIYVQPIVQSPWYNYGYYNNVISDVYRGFDGSVRVGSAGLQHTNASLNSLSVGSGLTRSITATASSFSTKVSEVHDGMAQCSMDFSDSLNREVLTSGTAGFTTKGSISNQNFEYGAIGALEETKHSVCIYMTGTEAEVVTTRSKARCEVCGQTNAYGNKFCTGCGTYIAK